MCWPFEIALPCAVDQGPQHNELYPLADSLPRLIGQPAFSTLMGLALPIKSKVNLGLMLSKIGIFRELRLFSSESWVRAGKGLSFSMIRTLGAYAWAW
jgi:hypothetical protein